MPSGTVARLLIITMVFETGGVFCLDITYAEEHTDGRLLCKHEETDDELLRVQWYKSSRDDIFKNGKPAVVSWNGTKHSDNSDNYGAGEDFSLIIYNMSHSDMGIYSCYVIHDTGEDNIHVYKYFVRLIVYGRVDNAADLIAEHGTLVSLPCRNNLTTDVGVISNVLWYKGSKAKNFQGDDQVIASWTHGEKHSVDNYNLNDNFSLEIGSVSSKNEGTYRCIAATERKASAGDTQVSAYGRVDSAVDLIAEYGTLVSLPCLYNLTSDMAGVISNIRWYKGSKAKSFQGSDQAIASWKNGEKHSVDNYSMNDDFSLAIGRVSSKNEGMYRCIAATDQRKASAGDTQVSAYALPRGVPLLNVTILPNSIVVNCSVDYVYPVLYPEFGFHHDKEYSVENDDGTYNTSISGQVTDNLHNRTVECFFPHFNYTKSSSYYIRENFSKCTLETAGEHECTQTSRLGLIIGVALGILSLMLVGTVLFVAVLITRKKSIKQRQQNDIKQKEVMERMLVI